MKKPSGAEISDQRVIGISLLVSLSDVVLNLLVALLTRSVVMMSQSLQGLSDVSTAAILMIGVRRSRRQADKKHPYGYGREIYFWVLIAGLFMFAGTGALSAYLGYRQIVQPHAVENIAVALGMISFGLITNGYAFSRSVKRLNQAMGKESVWRRLIHSGMVETKATFLVDGMGTLAAVLGFVSLLLFVITGNPRFDGAGGLMVGLSMMTGALLLIRDVKEFIVGRSVPDTVNNRIISTCLRIKEVQSVLDLRTTYLGSSKLHVMLEVHLADNLSTDTIEKIIDQIKRTVKRDIPHVHHIQVEVETPDEELVDKAVSVS